MSRYLVVIVTVLALGSSMQAQANSVEERLKNCTDFAAMPNPISPKGLLLTKDLVKNCTVPAGPGYYLCIGYLGGVLEMLHHLSAEKRSCVQYCAPVFPPTERRKILLDWVKKNPGQGHVNAVHSVRQAFSQAYPCEKQLNYDQLER